MADRPELFVAVAGQKSKASEYNQNFEKIMDYVEDSIEEQQETMEETLSVYQDIVVPVATSGEIALETNKVYRITPTGAVDFTLPVTLDNTKFHQILVQLNLDTYYSVSLNTAWGFNDKAPVITSAGKYNVFYEYDGARWVCGVMKKSEVE